MIKHTRLFYLRISETCRRVLQKLRCCVLTVHWWRNMPHHLFILLLDILNELFLHRSFLTQLFDILIIHKVIFTFLSGFITQQIHWCLDRRLKTSFNRIIGFRLRAPHLDLIILLDGVKWIHVSILNIRLRIPLVSWLLQRNHRMICILYELSLICLILISWTFIRIVLYAYIALTFSMLLVVAILTNMLRRIPRLALRWRRLGSLLIHISLILTTINLLTHFMLFYFIN